MRDRRQMELVSMAPEGSESSPGRPAEAPSCAPKMSMAAGPVAACADAKRSCMFFGWRDSSGDGSTRSWGDSQD